MAKRKSAKKGKRRKIDWSLIIISVETGLLFMFVVFTIWFYAGIWRPIQDSMIQGKAAGEALEVGKIRAELQNGEEMQLTQ